MGEVKLILSRQADGRLRVAYLGWQEAKVVHVGQALGTNDRCATWHFLTLGGESCTAPCRTCTCSWR
jgi:hypothetical protein